MAVRYVMAYGRVPGNRPPTTRECRLGPAGRNTQSARALMFAARKNEEQRLSGKLCLSTAYHGQASICHQHIASHASGAVFVSVVLRVMHPRVMRHALVSVVLPVCAPSALPRRAEARRCFSVGLVLSRPACLRCLKLRALCACSTCARRLEASCLRRRWAPSSTRT